MARGNCRCCGNEYSINADGTVRYHITDKPECRDPEDANSRKCNGVGQRPAGADEPEAGAGYVCRIPAGPEGCGKPVQLTLNGRARSHLNNRDKPCGGGSDWPLWHDGRGGYTDHAPPAPADLPHDRGADPHAQEADIAIAEAERIQREQDADYATALRDGMAESRARIAGDGRMTDEQFADAITRQENPMGSALAELMRGKKPSPLEAAAADQVECACNLRWRTVEAMRAAGHDDMDCDSSPMLHPEAPQPGAGELFDVTHRLTDASGVEWIHPGEAVRCVLPDCCTHPQGFEYGDDGKGHSGSFCPVCGTEEPGPDGPCEIIEPDDPNACGQCVDCNPAEAWRTPAHLILDMAPDVQELAATNPECWDCGHEVTPRAERFGPDSRITHVVWECSGGRNCRCALSGPCRPQRPEQDRIGNLAEGVLFRRHTARPPLNGLVFRVQKVHPEAVESVVVSAGPYGGRTGMLTNLTEEITCTDLNGKPRPRRTPTPQRSSSPQPDPATTITARSSTPVTPASAPMTTDAQSAGDFLAAGSGSYGEAEAKYGRWGRYKLIHPSTGRTVEWTRATTFAKSISDTFTLSQWGKRNVLVGATLRPDIVALAHGKDVSRDREDLNQWAEELEKAAGSKVAANLGTAVHSFTEQIDRNWARRHEVYREEIPNEFKPYVGAYIRLLEDYGLEPVPHLIEFSTGVLQYEVMGTSDNCYRATRHIVLRMPRGEVRLSPGEHVIGDKKTGKDLSYGWQEICIQLALYAQGMNTLGVFDWESRTWEPDPLSRFAEPGTKVRDDVGVILHLPVDPRSKKDPALYGVDLESGWNAAVLCERVRTWRKLRTLAGPVAVVEDGGLDEGEAPTTRPPTLRERAETVTSKPEASAVYQDAVAAGLPVDEVKELIAIMQERIARVAEPGGSKV
jgi:hypothetical protein